MTIQKKRIRSTFRRGVAATETAIMLPLLVIVVFGSIELANGIFLRQTLAQAAYEGARAATRPGATVQDAEARIAEVLLARSVDDYDVDISPAIVATTPRNTEVTVTITAPASEYSVGPVRFFAGASITHQVRMVRL
jgi:Flp pilus assembly protein TadG